MDAINNSNQWIKVKHELLVKLLTIINVRWKDSFCGRQMCMKKKRSRNGKFWFF